MCNPNLYFNNHNDYKIDYVYCCAMGGYTTYHGSVHETSDRWVYYLQNSSSVLSIPWVKYLSYQMIFNLKVIGFM
jgi:hypothetical protein